MTAPEQPRTKAGQLMLSGFSGIAGYRPRRSREVVGIRESILDIEREAFWQGVASVEEVAGPKKVDQRFGKRRLYGDR